MLEAKRRIGIFLALGVLLASIVAFTVHSRVAAVEAQLGQETTIYLTARPIPAQRPLAADDLSPKRIPRSFLQRGMVTDPKVAVGKVLAVALAQGDLLTESVLTTRFVIPEGYRALRMYHSQTIYFDDNLQVGDHVDLVATTVDEAKKLPSTRLYLPNLPVVETDAKSQWVAILVQDADVSGVIFTENYARQLQLLRRSPHEGGEPS